MTCLTGRQTTWLDFSMDNDTASRPTLDEMGLPHPEPTVTVADVVRRVNGLLANSADDRREGRVGLSVFVEGLLLDTGNYHGFTYLDPDGLSYADTPEGFDSTRRAYHIKENS